MNFKGWIYPIYMHLFEKFGDVIAGAIGSIRATFSVSHTLGRIGDFTSAAMLYCPGNTIPSNDVAKHLQVLVSLKGIPGAPVISSSDLFIDFLQSYRFILVVEKNQCPSLCQEAA
jgi:hypothetical protein